MQACKTIAYAFSIVSTVICAIGLIPLCWMVPMTIHLNKCRKGEASLSIGFGICELLFVNIISGILCLVANDN